MSAQRYRRKLRHNHGQRSYNAPFRCNQRTHVLYIPKASLSAFDKWGQAARLGMLICWRNQSGDARGLVVAPLQMGHSRFWKGAKPPSKNAANAGKPLRSVRFLLKAEGCLETVVACLASCVYCCDSTGCQLRRRLDTGITLTYIVQKMN